MERFSVRLGADDDEHGKTYEFHACDAQAMLSWLQHNTGVSSTRLLCNGHHPVQLVQLGRGCDQ
jgi:hypothetical protein